MNIEHDVRYRSGKRTFVYLFITHGWWLFALGAGSLYLAYDIYLGPLQSWASSVLAAHPDWFVSSTMLAEWGLLLGFAFLFVAYLRTSVLYRAYSFHVDEHALHLRRGLIRVQEITIPYRQISDIHIEQPYHWRLFGLASLDITITSSHTSIGSIHKKREFLVPCIDTALGRALAHFLAKQASGEDEDIEDEDDDLEEEDAEDFEIERPVIRRT